MFFRFLMRWVIRAVAVLAVLFTAVYLGDWAIYRLRGSPQSKVTVNHYVPIPMKGRRTEFDYIGTVDTPCAVALFSQGGESSCWRLRRNTNEGITM